VAVEKSILIVDDVSEMRELLKQTLRKLDIHKIYEAGDAKSALASYKQTPTDAVFLDINMDELTGIELPESSKIDSQVIFTTAYQEYALKGYELNVTDYLLKPFTFERFLQAVNKAQENLVQAIPSSKPNFIFVKTENRLEKITLDDIIYIEGMRDYRRIHTVNKKVMTLQNFKELEQIIPSNIVCRVHKSYMVGLNKIESIGENKVIMFIFQESYCWDNFGWL